VGNLQPDGLYQSIYRFLSPGEHKINAVVQYQLGGGGPGGGGGTTIQAISNTVTINILKETGSLAPTASIVFPADRSTITSASSLRLLAEAADPDGNLVGVQFYINGIAYGSEIIRTSSYS
ncbi:MAG: Ig-like domain-containing protein, partial [Opitutae bacterium]